MFQVLFRVRSLARHRRVGKMNRKLVQTRTLFNSRFQVPGLQVDSPLKSRENDSEIGTNADKPKKCPPVIIAVKGFVSCTCALLWIPPSFHRWVLCGSGGGGQRCGRPAARPRSAGGRGRGGQEEEDEEEDEEEVIVCFPLSIDWYWQINKAICSSLNDSKNAR